MRYPIGKFELPTHRDPALRMEYVRQIGDLPGQLRAVVDELRAYDLLNERYREGGWTGRQVVHHIADSHTHAYQRVKRTITEDHPTIQPYDEGRWAELPDVTIAPVRTSLDLIEALHIRLAVTLSQVTDAQWDRTAHHAGSGWTYHLDTLAAHYAWHGRHHLAHLQQILHLRSVAPSTNQ